MAEQKNGVDFTDIKRKLLAMREDCRNKVRGQLSATRLERSQSAPFSRADDSDYEDSSEVVNLELMRLNDCTCRAIDQALDRIAAKTYGICQNLKCGGAIPMARLEAVPFATLCTQCQENQEGQGAENRSSRRMLGPFPPAFLRTQRRTT